eukprot:m.46657 g.46657  ORF g.46657 m.46657 type:complete len:398 (-) comp8793_c0_seq1:14506-15699(-)
MAARLFSMIRQCGQCQPSPWACRLRGMASFYDQTVERKGRQQAPAVSVSELLVPSGPVDDATLIASALHVNERVAIRLAKRLRIMNSMPFIFGINPHIHRLYHLYHKAFTSLTSCRPPTTISEALRLSEGLYAELLSETAVVLPTLAKASKELNASQLNGMVNKKELASFFNSILSGRILRRMLMYHHLMLTEQYLKPGAIPSHPSAISDHCDVTACANRAFVACRQICVRKYGRCPELVIHGQDDRPIQPIQYVESHLIFMLLELFKNSARATIESTSVKGPLPKIEMFVFQTATDLVQIHVKDSGGGIPPDLTDSIFEYGVSNQDPSDDESLPDVGLPPGIAARPMNGEGFGLPMAQQYARFFGGDLTVHNTEGYGTEMYLKLREPHTSGSISVD